jgi:hypothetical protein
MVQIKATYLGVYVLWSVRLAVAMLFGSLVTTAWRVFRLRMEERVSRYGG